MGGYDIDLDMKFIRIGIDYGQRKEICLSVNIWKLFFTINFGKHI